jgi:hypothetical protein
MKRFTETTKWDDPWFRKLSPKLKCLWGFICDRCDSAGVIEVDYEVASVQIGQKVTEADMQALGDRVELLECGKWWVIRFVAFQYGKLSEDCKPHVQVLQLLGMYNLRDRVSKGYAKGIHTPKDNIGTGNGKGTGGDERIEIVKAKDRADESEVIAYCLEIGLPESDGRTMFAKWEGNGWSNGGKPIKDWKATIRSWRGEGYLPSQKVNGKPSAPTDIMRGVSVGPIVQEHDPEAILRAEAEAFQRGE